MEAEIKIEVAALVGYALACAAEYFLAAAAWIIFRKKTKARALPFVVGIVAFFFILIIRGLVRLVVINEAIKQTPWLAYLLMALAAGIFEEAGRYLVFKKIMPNHDEWKDALSYGLGHGGMEIFLVYGVEGTSAGGLVLGLMYNIGGLEAFGNYYSENTIPALLNISRVTLGDNLLHVYDCAAAIALHTALSVIVFCAAHYAMNKKYLITAMALHTAANFVGSFRLMGLTSAGLGAVLDLPVTAGVCFFAYRVYKKYKDDE